MIRDLLMPQKKAKRYSIISRLHTCCNDRGSNSYRKTAKRLVENPLASLSVFKFRGYTVLECDRHDLAVGYINPVNDRVYILVKDIGSR